MLFLGVGIAGRYIKQSKINKFISGCKNLFCFVLLGCFVLIDGINTGVAMSLSMSGTT